MLLEVLYQKLFEPIRYDAILCIFFVCLKYLIDPDFSIFPSEHARKERDRAHSSAASASDARSAHSAILLSAIGTLSRNASAQGTCGNTSIYYDGQFMCRLRSVHTFDTPPTPMINIATTATASVFVPPLVRMNSFTSVASMRSTASATAISAAVVMPVPSALIGEGEVQRGRASAIYSPLCSPRIDLPLSVPAGGVFGVPGVTAPVASASEKPLSVAAGGMSGVLAVSAPVAAAYEKPSSAALASASVVASPQVLENVGVASSAPVLTDRQILAAQVGETSVNTDYLR